jgi:hypothetical protein
MAKCFAGMTFIKKDLSFRLLVRNGQIIYARRKSSLRRLGFIGDDRQRRGILLRFLRTLGRGEGPDLLDLKESKTKQRINKVGKAANKADQFSP